MEQCLFDLIIIGGGHAGVEAAWVASQFKLKVALISIKGVDLASTPCNPSIGGPGKSQVVREIDALGGLMGKLADISGIQFRTLNESRGYAVQSTRIQVDKEVYSKNATAIIFDNSYINIIYKKVIEINKNSSFFIVKTEDKSLYESKKLLITAGTFLGGRTHIGYAKKLGGRIGACYSSPLKSILSNVKVLNVQFKTGTPPRIYKDSIDYSKLKIQNSDIKANNFHWRNGDNCRFQKQVSCFITYTGEKTHKIIKENMAHSPLFNGQIKGIGPRYCPSIEDKVFRYPNKNSHQIFLEPEGNNLETVYPSGISTSLPAEIQEEVIRSIAGLENAVIENYGYAVEYDVIDTSYLSETLEYKKVKGLYFAGQVNGTSGYEEAAGQGLVAGLNASLSVLNRSSIILDKYDSYIGQMVEDLINSTRDEPYRLFTARCENRLFIREDNTINRMFSYRNKFSINESIDKFQRSYMDACKALKEACIKENISNNQQNRKYFISNNYGRLPDDMNLGNLLKRSKLNCCEVLKRESLRLGINFPSKVINNVAIDFKYVGYIDRYSKQIEKIKRLDKKTIDWKKLSTSSNVSFECRERILKTKPKTFYQLKKVHGIRPATLMYVMNYL